MSLDYMEKLTISNSCKKLHKKMHRESQVHCQYTWPNILTTATLYRRAKLFQRCSLSELFNSSSCFTRTCFHDLFIQFMTLDLALVCTKHSKYLEKRLGKICTIKQNEQENISRFHKILTAVWYKTITKLNWMKKKKSSKPSIGINNYWFSLKNFKYWYLTTIVFNSI